VQRVGGVQGVSKVHWQRRGSASVLAVEGEGGDSRSLAGRLARDDETARAANGTVQKRPSIV